VAPNKQTSYKIKLWAALHLEHKDKTVGSITFEAVTKTLYNNKKKTRFQTSFSHEELVAVRHQTVSKTNKNLIHLTVLSYE
jgi:hypothetical protein